MRTTVEAVRRLEGAVTGASWTEGIALRYGAFYGPGTNFSRGPEGAFLEAIRKRQLPLVGKAGGSLVLHPHRGCRGRHGERDRGR